MSNGKKISQLAPGGSIEQQDYLPVARGSDETYKIAAKQFVVNAITQGSGIPIVIGKEDGAGQTLLFRSLSGVDGISIVNVGNTTVVSGSGQNPIKTVFTGTGSQVNFPFTLTNTSSRNVNNYRVDIDGVLQEPGQTADYYLSGSNLTFTSAPPLSSKIVVVSNNLLPLAESVPANNSIINAMFTDGCINTVELSSSVISMLVPTGAIMPFYRPTAPNGWLICDGSAISSQYTALTALVGANTPNLRGMFIRGWSSGTSTTSRDPLSASRTLGSVQGDEFRSHNHGGITGNDSPDHTHSNNAGSPGLGQGQTGPNTVQQSGGTENTDGASTRHQHSISSQGDLETRPVNIALLYCIKT